MTDRHGFLTLNFIITHCRRSHIFHTLHDRIVSKCEHLIPVWTSYPSSHLIAKLCFLLVSVYELNSDWLLDRYLMFKYSLKSVNLQWAGVATVTVTIAKAIAISRDERTEAISLNSPLVLYSNKWTHKQYRIWLRKMVNKWLPYPLPRHNGLMTLHLLSCEEGVGRDPGPREPQICTCIYRKSFILVLFP